MFIDEYLNSYSKGTVETVRGSRMHGTVELSLRPYSEDAISVVVIDLILQRGVPNEGTASEALDWLCAMADRFHVILYLSPEPADSQMLLAWYSKRRFVPVEHNYMRRDPND